MILTALPLTSSYRY